VRILHLCLSCFYIDKFSYQENELVRQNVLDGHQVAVIASVENYGADGKLTYDEPREYMGTDGAPVARLAYSGPFPASIQRKLRMHSGVYERIAEFGPDVILFHGACGWELNAAGRYVRDNPHVTLYVDSHEDVHNSARGFVSKWLLHWSYYRPILRRNLRYIEKVLPVSVSCMEFMRDFYGVLASQLEFYPLGGFVLDDADYDEQRRTGRELLGVADDQVLIVQSGKIDATKKLVEALEALAAVDDPALRFVVAGKIMPDVASKVEAMVAADPRVRLLGWKSADELRTILAAADVYSQPGTQSATMQMGISNRCAILLDDVPSHHPYFDRNGWLVGKHIDLKQVFQAISHHKAMLPGMAERSKQLALRMLDYRLLAARLYRNRQTSSGKID